MLKLRAEALRSGLIRADTSVWKCFNDLFSYFILTALIDDEVFAVHGGLSPSIQSIDQIRDLDRTADVGSISFLWIV